MSIESPGSLLTFAEQIGVEPTKATHYYTEALAKYREELAREQDLTLEELHELPHPINIDVKDNEE